MKDGNDNSVYTLEAMSVARVEAYLRSRCVAVSPLMAVCGYCEGAAATHQAYRLPATPLSYRLRLLPLGPVPDCRMNHHTGPPTSLAPLFLFLVMPAHRTADRFFAAPSRINHWALLTFGAFDSDPLGKGKSGKDPRGGGRRAQLVNEVFRVSRFE
ncbi:hypothetical protein J6590_020629 [Homalodisca vitripennis]|nr:hypothetical protein J6590_020629 [Homalodisca vitripennis]